MLGLRCPKKEMGAHLSRYHARRGAPRVKQPPLAAGFRANSCTALYDASRRRRDRVLGLPVRGLRGAPGGAAAVHGLRLNEYTLSAIEIQFGRLFTHQTRPWSAVLARPSS